MINSLVTGGAGAIGSRLIQRLLNLGHSITVLDDLSSGFVDNVPADVEFIHEDMITSGVLSSILNSKPFHFIFHCAALFANQNSIENPIRDLMVNGMGTLLLAIEAQQQMHIGSLQRLVYLSSSCVYGNYSGSLKEDINKQPETPYAITKLLGENYFNFFTKQYNLPSVTVRLFNAYGPGERPGRFRNVIPNFISLALRGEPLIITGSGKETRDFTFIDDIVDGILITAVKPGIDGEILNIATGVEIEIGTLAQKIIKISNSNSEIQYAPRRNWDHTLRRCGNIDKAKKIGYMPKTNLDDGLKITIDWMRSLDVKTS